MFDGFFQLEATALGVVIVRTPSGAPVDSDLLPTYRVYGPAGLMSGQSGSLVALDTGPVTSATDNTPIVITSANHNRVTGDRVSISGVLGNAWANGSWSVTVIDSNTFSLDESSPSGAYTSGGQWHAAGVYVYSIPVTTANGYLAGTSYTVEVSCQIGGAPFAEPHTFIVS